MNWYTPGYDGIKREEDRAAAANGPRRLWIPAGQSKNLILVDDEPFTCYEHSPKINGDWKNWLTCAQGVSDDVPCCEILGPNSRYFIGYYTVIDCSEYIDSKGNKHTNELKLFGAKMKTLKKIKRKKEEKGSLIGRKFRATREDQKSPSVGDDFEFGEEVDLAQVFNSVMYKGKKLADLYAQPAVLEQLKRTFQVIAEGDKLVRRVTPFNYMEALKPRDAKDVRVLLKGAELEESSAGAKPGKSADDETPF